MCKEFVKRSLHDPESADFESSKTYPVTEEAGGIFTVEVSVRARNAFNAMRNTIVSCKAKREESGWTLLNLENLNNEK